mmetsp:Transcript_13513/g.26595  ORF Transcript_13513/g.26595 Transcript_13513/m.26595 type:complete len:263 (+) Transcript_13513:563-1351(+)
MCSIHAQMTMGLCQSSSYSLKKEASESVMRSKVTNSSRCSTSRAAWTRSSTDAMPYLTMLNRRSLHFEVLSSLETIIHVFANESNTLPSATTLNAHHLLNVSETNRAKANGTKALTWSAKASNGEMSNSPSSSKFPACAATVVVATIATKSSMKTAARVVLPSMVNTVPFVKRVAHALYFTKSLISYRQILWQPPSPTTTSVTEYLKVCGGSMWWRISNLIASLILSSPGGLCPFGSHSGGTSTSTSPALPPYSIWMRPSSC